MTSKTRTVRFGGQQYTLDAHGYLDPSDQWDERFAEGMAARLGVPGGLTDEHWEIVRYLRERFLAEQAVPMVVQACIDNGLRLSRLRGLFPTGYTRGACRIAGINYLFLYASNKLLTYENYSTLATQYRLSDAGFLEDFDAWDTRFAQLVAQGWSLPSGLTRQHFRIIDFLRDAYRQHRRTPLVYETCRAHALDIDELCALFPEGYRRGACRAAGLPFFD